METMSLFQYMSYDSFPVTYQLLLVLFGIISWILFRSVLPPRVKYGKPVPGPIGLPIVGYLPFLGNPPKKKLLQLSKKYGDVIGLYLGTKYTVVLNEYNVMKDVLGHPGAQDRASNLFDFIPTTGFHTQNGEKWIEQRRFSSSATRDIGLGRGHWEDLIMEETTNFTDKLKATKGKPFEFSHDLSASVLSNILSLLIGRRLKEDKEADKIQLSVDFIEVSLHFLGPAMATSLIPGLRKFYEIFNIAGYGKASKTVRDFFEFTREEINLHKTSASVKGNNDFISVYLEKIVEMEKSKNQNHMFSETSLLGNFVAMFIGASDTIHKSLCWLLRLMAAHPDVQKKVYDELMETAGKEGRVRFHQRDQFPYTFATVKEAQRISSLVPLSPGRVATQDIKVQDKIIPKGSEITANLWAIHNDPNYWDQPELFKPERFLEENGTKLIKNVPGYAAFSYGRRNCPGTSIAYMEILFYFSEIIKRFEICLPPGAKPEFKAVEGLVTSLEPQPICFKERKNDA